MPFCHLQECLEAEFYSWAAFGHGLNSTLLGGGPGSVGGQKAVFVLEATMQYVPTPPCMAAYTALSAPQTGDVSCKTP